MIVYGPGIDGPCTCMAFKVRPSESASPAPESFRDHREGGKGTIAQRLHWLVNSAHSREEVVESLSDGENAERQLFYRQQFIERRDALIADVESLLCGSTPKAFRDEEDADLCYALARYARHRERCHAGTDPDRFPCVCGLSEVRNAVAMRLDRSSPYSQPEASDV